MAEVFGRAPLGVVDHHWHDGLSGPVWEGLLPARFSSISSPRLHDSVVAAEWMSTSAPDAADLGVVVPTAAS